MALISQRLGRNQHLQTAATNKPPLRAGSNGEGVKTLQAALVELRFRMPISTHNGKIAGDGIYGEETTKTVRLFQQQQGLSADGIAGTDTLNRLDQIFVGREAKASTRDRFFDMLNTLWT